MHNEESVRLYRDFIGGSERSTPPNPQETPRKPPGNPQVTAITSNKMELKKGLRQQIKISFILLILGYDCRIKGSPIIPGERSQIHKHIVKYIKLLLIINPNRLLNTSYN